MTQAKVKRPQLKRVITDAVVQVDVKWRPFWGRYRTDEEEQRAIRREAEEVLETVQQLPNALGAYADLRDSGAGGEAAAAKVRAEFGMGVG